MKRFAALIIKYSKTALFGFIGLVVLMTGLGVQSFGHLQAGGYENPNSDSTKVTQLLSSEFKQNIPEIVAVVDFDTDATNANSADIASRLTTRMKRIDGVAKVSSFYSLGQPTSLLSKDGKAVYFFVELKKDAVDADVAGTFEDTFTQGFEGAKVYLSGAAIITSEINTTISDR